MATKPSAIIDTRVIYCGDNLDQLRKFPAACVDLIYIDPPFNSNRNYEVFWGETKEKRSFERVMAKRLKKDCELKEDEKLWAIGRGFIVRDLPKTEEELRKYPPFEFENWAVVALGGIPNKAHVGDFGIDGRIYPVGAMPAQRARETGEMEFMDVWYPVQVKQRDKVGRPDIDAFEAVMMREDRKLGYFVGFDFSGDALFEIDRFRRKQGREIKAMTVREILSEEIERGRS